MRDVPSPIPLCALCGNPLARSPARILVAYHSLPGIPTLGWHLECERKDEAASRIHSDPPVDAVEFLREIESCGEGRVSRRRPRRRPARAGQDRTPRVHYAGRIRTATRMVLPGWAACCSGDRAERIRESGANTPDRSSVTCQACITALQEGDDYAEKRLARN